MGYFIVKKPLKINGKIYRKCVCYEADAGIEDALTKLEEKGLIRRFESYVYFQSGRIIEKKTKSETTEKPYSETGVIKQKKQTKQKDSDISEQDTTEQ